MYYILLSELVMLIACNVMDLFNDNLRQIEA